MKKFYIGFGVAAVLMIGGIVTSITWNPKVDMVSMGKYFYNAPGHNFRVERQKEFSRKIISGDKTHLKLEIKFNDLKGDINLRDLINCVDYRNEEENKILSEYTINEFSDEVKAKDKRESVKTLNQEIIKYKWVEEPYNIIITKSDVRLIGQKDSTRVVTTVNPIVEGGKIPLEGTINVNKNFPLEKDRLESEEVYIYGKKGSGTLEVEIESIYK